MTWHHFTLSSLFPPLQSIFQAFYSNLPLLSHSFPIVLRHIPSFVHCLSQISDIWHEDCIAYKIWAKTELLHITCVSSPHIETAIFPLLFHYAIMVPHRSLNFTWHHFTLSLFFPPFFLAYQFSKRSTQSFHCFPIFSIVLYHSRSFFPLFSSSFSPPFPFFPIVLCHIPSFFHCFSHHFPSFSPPFPFFPLFYIIFPHFFHCFSHHFPLHCNLPKSTSEGGPGGNRYPTVTQLPPGT